MAHRVAFFGGSFNPPHFAHVFAVVYALGTGEVDEVLVVPCFIHPFAKPLAPFEDRLELCMTAFGWLPNTTVSEVERELGGESRTLRTLRHLHAKHPDWELRLVVGSDVVDETPRWAGFDEIRALAPPLVLGRPGAGSSSGHGSLFPAISSTEVRTAVAKGDLERARQLVPLAVLNRVLARGLYGNRSS